MPAASSAQNHPSVGRQTADSFQMTGQGPAITFLESDHRLINERLPIERDNQTVPANVANQ